MPASKLLWGGDCSRVEAALGALEMAKDILARVLMAQVREFGYMSERQATGIARRVLHDNAAELFFGG